MLFISAVFLPAMLEIGTVCAIVGIPVLITLLVWGHSRAYRAGLAGCAWPDDTPDNDPYEQAARRR